VPRHYSLSLPTTHFPLLCSPLLAISQSPTTSLSRNLPPPHISQADGARLEGNTGFSTGIWSASDSTASTATASTEVRHCVRLQVRQRGPTALPPAAASTAAQHDGLELVNPEFHIELQDADPDSTRRRKGATPTPTGHVHEPYHWFAMHERRVA
jgi:hypothetical protein